MGCLVMAYRSHRGNHSNQSAERGVPAVSEAVAYGGLTRVLSICLSVCLSVHLSVCLSVCLSLQGPTLFQRQKYLELFLVADNREVRAQPRAPRTPEHPDHQSTQNTKTPEHPEHQSTQTTRTTSFRLRNQPSRPLDAVLTQPAAA